MTTVTDDSKAAKAMSTGIDDHTEASPTKKQKAAPKATSKAKLLPKKSSPYKAPTIEDEDDVENVDELQGAGISSYRTNIANIKFEEDPAEI